MSLLRFNTIATVGILWLLLIGCHLRTFRLDEFPPGISNDEAINLIDGAYLSQSGRLPLFQDHQRPEPLNRIYGALTSLFFGSSVWAFRFTSTLWGMLCLAGVYWASQQCFYQQPRRLRRLMGLLALASLAAALGHIAVSRSVYRAVPLVFFAALVTGFTCRALRTGALRDYIMTGLCLALGCYTYTVGLALPIAYLPLALHQLVFRRGHWRNWLPGLAAAALVLLVLTLPIGYLLLTQPEAIFARAGDVAETGQIDWLARLQGMAAQFLSSGDENPQYNVADAPLVPPLFAPFFIVGLVTLTLRPRQPSSALILGLLVASALPTMASNEITHGLRMYAAFAFTPLITAASLIAPYKLAGRFPRAVTALSFGCLAGIMFLAGGAAIQARQVYADYWIHAGEYWRKWRVHGLELSHSEWFFRSDKRLLADWIIAQDTPLLIPMAELDYPVFRAYLMAAFPRVEPMPAGFALPPQTQVLRPWSLALGAFPAETSQLALLHENIITALPPLTVEDKRLIFGNEASATELNLPESAYPAVARIQPAPPGWTPRNQSPARDEILARFNGELELGSYRGPRAIAGPGDYEFILDWSVSRPVSHEYGAFLQLLSEDWQVVAGEDKRLWRWLYPTVLWRPGQAFSQPFTLAIAERLPPGVYRLVAGASHINSGELAAESFVGGAWGGIATIGWVKVAQERSPTIPPGALPLAYEFGGLFRLNHIALARDESGVLEVNLYWTALKSFPPENATIFLHALDDKGALLAQSDKRPWDGRYPTTIWEAGETVMTSHQLEISDGVSAELVLGMYTLPDVARLPARSRGQRLDDDLARLGSLSELLARQDA